jgi:hypothetical protein
MLRKFLTIVLPIALPLIVYFGYLALARRRAQRSGGPPPPRWQEAPWHWILLVGVSLMIAALIFWRVTGGVPPGTKLEAPRLIDGEVVPGRVVE